MAKFFLYLGSFTAVITIFGTVAYFSIFKNNDQQPLTVIQNVSQEEKKEEINNVVNNSTILDNVIINIIIFLLIFVIVLIFFFYSDFFLVTRVNSKKVQDINRSIFRRTGFFQGGSSLKKRDAFHEYFDDQSNKKIRLKFKEDEEKFENFPNDGIKREIEEITVEQIVNSLPADFEERKEVEKQKKKEIYDFFLTKENSALYKKGACYHIPNDNGIINSLKFNNADSNFQEYIYCFEGKIDFFNCYNIFASLLSLLLLLLSFGIPYFVFHFLYALIYAFLEEVEENKFLFALYRVWKVIIFSNFQGLLKIIPFIAFLIGLFSNSIIFFGKNIFFYPIIYDVSNKKDKLEERVMNIYEYPYIDKKNFLKTGKVEFSVDNNFYLLPPKEYLIKELKQMK